MTGTSLVAEPDRRIDYRDRSHAVLAGVVDVLFVGVESLVVEAVGHVTIFVFAGIADIVGVGSFAFPLVAVAADVDFVVLAELVLTGVVPGGIDDVKDVEAVVVLAVPFLDEAELTKNQKQSFTPDPP